MVLLGVVGFVEDQEVDLVDLNEAAVEAVQQDLGCADNHHVFSQLLVPKFSGLHDDGLAVELGDGVLKIGAEDGILLEAEGDLFDQEECNLGSLSNGPVFQLLI